MTLAPINSPVTEFEARVAAAKSGDLATFSKAVFDEDMEPHQTVWEEALDSMDKVVIVCPPDTHKSTTIQRWVEKEIGKNHNLRVLWLMNAGDQAMKRMISISNTLRYNPIYTRAFHTEPDEDAAWTKTAIYLKRDNHGPDPTLMACGLNGPYQGSHFDIIIIDDPTDPRDVNSPATMESQRMLMRGMISDRLVSGGRMVVILTRWGEADLIPCYEEMGYTIIEMPIMADYPWGPTISTNLFPTSRCEEIHFRAGDQLWQLTYMCNPRGAQGGVIPRDCLKYWDRDNLPSSANLALMAVDLATSEKNWADPTCIGTALFDIRTRCCYITDLWTEQANIIRVEEEFEKRASKTARLVSIGVETVGFQLSFLQRMRRNKRYPIRELPYRSRRQSTTKAIGIDRDKNGRAQSIASKFREGKLFLAKDLPLFKGVSVEDELCGFPFAAHDDRLDVIAFLSGLTDAHSGLSQRLRLVPG